MKFFLPGWGERAICTMGIPALDCAVIHAKIGTHCLFQTKPEARSYRNQFSALFAPKIKKDLAFKLSP
jgi:hypothetical protein